MNPSPTTNRSVLLVEDDACTAVLFKNILQREGYTVQHICDGEAAMQVLWQNRFDAVVLDLMMPKLDGVQVLKAMRSLPEHVSTPVIIITAAKLKMVEAEAQRYGAKLFLDKTQTDKLIAGLRQIMAETLPGQSGLRMAPLAPLQADGKPQTAPPAPSEPKPIPGRVGSLFQAKS
jgi:CheY-like chemotaxis protein